MSEERNVAVVVQARVNSTRVPRKMVRHFAGTSLFKILLDKIKSSKVIPHRDVILSIGESELISISRKYSFQRFKRTQASCDSTNNPNIPDSLTLLYEWYNELGKWYTHVVLVSACHPLLTVDRIEEFYVLMRDTNIDGAFSVVEKKNYYWDHYGSPITDWQGAQLMNTKRVKPVYEGAHCLYGSRIDFIEKELWMSDKYPPEPYLFVVDDIEATDIDTMADFEKAEVLYKYYYEESKGIFRPSW